jgi:hypothetical protein
MSPHSLSAPELMEQKIAELRKGVSDPVMAGMLDLMEVMRKRLRALEKRAEEGEG